MVTKKIRTEYMKKFRDPKWETFSKCYEDSLKYRLTRRVMEHSHKPWFWEGWDSGSDTSGWSTPKLTRNKIAPLTVPPPTSSEVQQRLWESKSKLRPRSPSEDGENDVGARDAPAARPTGPEVKNGVSEINGGSGSDVLNTGRPSDDTATDNGPADTSDEEPVNPVPKGRHHRCNPRSESGRRDSSHDDKPLKVRKLPRAKSQPPTITKEKENWRPAGRLDRAEKQEVRRTQNQAHKSDACVQTRRESSKRGSNPERRRARSADVEKMKRSQLTVVEDCWMTEYMRCFSARLR
ncbi:centriole, cilia and spindle-associated protein isoform X2 [Genypterus blacodes]|uniref:centriole, cilia and spindle-associated protein isoform X2 n=1 Tax=Genypterus blacodes TaxID=154954 RepID=UPI003F761AB5